MAGKVYKNSRHVRWNWEQSIENPELVRYHVIIVDDKNRESKINKIFEQLQKINSGIEVIRKTEGKVANSRLRYLFKSFDSSVSPEIIQWNEFKSVKKDSNLYERKRGNIEDYVADLYWA